MVQQTKKEKKPKMSQMTVEGTLISRQMVANTTGSRKYVSQKLNEQRKHELKLAIIEAMAKNDELIYIAIALGATGTAIAMDAAEKLEEKLKELETGEDAEQTQSKKDDAIAQYADTLVNSFLSLSSTGFFGVAGLIGSKVYEKKPESWLEFTIESIEAGARNAAMIAVLILVLKAVFGGSGGENKLSSLLTGGIA